MERRTAKRTHIKSAVRQNFERTAVDAEKFERGLDPRDDTKSTFLSINKNIYPNEIYSW